MMITKQALIDDALRIEKLVGRNVCSRDLKQYGLFSCRTYTSRFGGLLGLLHAMGRTICLDWSLQELSPRDGAWLAGITDGEGCFRITQIKRSRQPTYHPLFNMNLRNDDRQVLEQIRRIWQLNRAITENPRSNGSRPASPQAVLHLVDLEVLFHKIVPTFRAYPLRSKKAADFELFAHVVEHRHQRRMITGKRHPPYEPGERELLYRFYLASSEVKKYEVTLQQVIEKYDLPLSNG